MGTQQKDWMLPASILVAAILISGSIIYLVKSGGVKPSGQIADTTQGQTVAGSNSDVLKIGGRDAIVGDPNAPVTVVEYADFQCPFCGRFFSTVGQQIRDKYIRSNKVKMVYRDFAFLGPESVASASAAECAKDQGKFWAYHDALYAAEIADGRENNGNLNRALFLKLAKDTGVGDMNTFTSCLDSNKYASVVSQTVADAQTVGVNSTPTTFVNGKEVTDSRGNSAGADPNLILQAIDKALAGS